MKLVVIVLVLLLAWLLFGSTRRRARGARRDGDPAPGRSTPVEDMVACVHCGVHLPASQALLLDGRSYCSEAHRSAGPRAP
jgi:uncharacterized protein